MNPIIKQTSLLVCIAKNKYAICDTLADCSKAVRNHINKNDLGSGQFYNNPKAGEILHHLDGKIGHVSYNGRVWDNNNNEISIN